MVSTHPTGTHCGDGAAPATECAAVRRKTSRTDRDVETGSYPEANGKEAPIMCSNGRLAVGAALGVVVIGPGAWAEGKAKAATMVTIRYGFRHDPMAWVETSASLQAAMARCSVLKAPKEGDAGLIRAEIMKDQAKREEQAKKGKVGAGRLDLLGVGAELELPEVARIGAFILEKAERDEDGAFGTYVARALCHAGLGKDEAVRRSLTRRVETVLKENPWRCCPWGPFLKVRELWLGRHVTDTSKALDHLVSILDEHANPVGNVHDKDPWGFIGIGGLIDHPRARGMVVRAIPVILRAQEQDGGWGDKGFQVFRALHRHGLIEPLQKLPPVPADWRVVRSIPAPDDKLRTLAWDGKRIWTLRPGDEGRLYAISPEDGAVLKTLPVNNKRVRGVGWRDGRLLLACGKPKSVREMDPQTGKVLSAVNLLGDIVFDLSAVAPVGDKVWVCDDYCPCIWEYAPAKPGKPVEAEVPTTELNPRYVGLAGPGPYDIAVQADSVWHCDWLTPLLVRSTPKGKLLDWGERPFSDVGGITHDGTNLWVLDGKSNRICIIEKTESGRDLMAKELPPNKPKQ